MSEVLIWQYNEFIQSRKEKLVNMLISEIIFLKTCFKKAKNKDEVSYLKIALDKLEYLLNRLKENSIKMSEKDFDKVIILIYRIFKDITENLKEEIRI
jgi:hypothetical protein